MALNRVRHYSIFFNSKKIAEAFKSGVDLNSGDELAYGDDGVIAISDGAVNTKLSFDMIIPTTKATVSIVDVLLAKQNVDMQLGLVDGKIWECQMRPTVAKFDTDMVKGTLNGSFTFIGGEPTIT